VRTHLGKKMRAYKSRIYFIKDLFESLVWKGEKGFRIKEETNKRNIRHWEKRVLGLSYYNTLKLKNILIIIIRLSFSKKMFFKI
jgi:hypothetical protein